MIRLKDRNRQIPNGLRFYLPVTKWTPRPNSNFSGISEALYRHLEGNPHVLKQLGWTLDLKFIEDKVDEFNAQLCEKMGWADYIHQVSEAGGGRPARAPFTSQPVRPSLYQSVKRVVVGGVSLVDWIMSGAEAVPLPQAHSRSLVCTQCPLNEQGDLLSFFTKPASEAIRAELTKRSNWGLSTPHDEQLGVCAACSCPLKLMVHVPLETKLRHMPQESFDALWENCWVRKEAK